MVSGTLHAAEVHGRRIRQAEPEEEGGLKQK